MAAQYFIQDNVVHTQQRCAKFNALNEWKGISTDFFTTDERDALLWCKKCIQYETTMADAQQVIDQSYEMLYHTAKGDKLHISKFCPSLKSRKRKFQKRKFYALPIVEMKSHPNEPCSVCMPFV